MTNPDQIAKEMELLKQAYNQMLTADDLKIRRDENGNIVPLCIPIPQFGASILFTPLTYGVSKGLPEGPITEWTAEEQLLLAKNCLIEPDISAFTEDDVLDMGQLLWENILMTIITYSGPLRKAGYDMTDNKGGFLEVMNAAQELITKN